MGVVMESGLNSDPDRSKNALGFLFRVYVMGMKG
jgi:hypothetical protein